MQRDTALGIDVGISNLGVGTCDGVTIGMANVDLRQEAAGVSVEQTPIRFIATAERFVEERAELFARVFCVEIEIQMKSAMEQLGQALGAMIKGRYPEVRWRSPRSDANAAGAGAPFRSTFPTSRPSPRAKWSTRAY